MSTSVQPSKRRGLSPVASWLSERLGLQESTGELHLLDRTKPTGQIVSASLIALASLVLGVWLVRRPG